MNLKFLTAVSLFLCGIIVCADSFPVVKDGKSLCEIQTGSGTYDSFAKQEFLE